MPKRTGGTPYIHQKEAEALGQQVRKLRIEKGMTQRDFGIEAGIDESTVLRIEKAKLIITVDLLFIIAKALNVSPKVLLDF